MGFIDESFRSVFESEGREDSASISVASILPPSDMPAAVRVLELARNYVESVEAEVAT